MFSRKMSITFVIAAVFVVVAAAPYYHKTRPPLRCSIPDRDYQYKTFSQPKRALSAVGITLRRPLADTDGNPRRRAIRAFQFVDTPVLQVDHCSLSKMSVLLHENGKWTVSFQADQNPANPNQLRDVTSAEPRTKQSSHLLRNKFHVLVTCYGGRGLAADSLVAKPVIVPLKLTPFWVQHGQPYRYYSTGHDPRIADNFDLFDRVEIELKYRID